MSKFILNDFQEWFAAYNQYLVSECVIAVLSGLSKTNKPAQFIYLDTKKHIDRGTLWVSGECDLEVLEIATEKQFFWQHKVIASSAKLDRVVHEFIRRLLEKDEPIA